MDLMVVLPGTGLEPGTIHIFVPMAEFERFREQLWTAISYRDEVWSSGLELDEPDETLGGPPVYWFTLDVRYGPKDARKFRLGLSHRLGSIVDRLEDWDLSTKEPRQARELYRGYFALLERDVKIVWARGGPRFGPVQ